MLPISRQISSFVNFSFNFSRHVAGVFDFRLELLLFELERGKIFAELRQKVLLSFQLCFVQFYYCHLLIPFTVFLNPCVLETCLVAVEALSEDRPAEVELLLDVEVDLEVHHLFLECFGVSEKFLVPA